MKLLHEHSSFNTFENIIKLYGFVRDNNYICLPDTWYNFFNRRVIMRYTCSSPGENNGKPKITCTGYGYPKSILSMLSQIEKDLGWETEITFESDNPVLSAHSCGRC